MFFEGVGKKSFLGKNGFKRESSFLFVIKELNMLYYLSWIEFPHLSISTRLKSILKLVDTIRI